MVTEKDSNPVCIACGAPATRQDRDGVPLCEGDYWHLVEHWRVDGFGARLASDQKVATEISNGIND